MGSKWITRCLSSILPACGVGLFAAFFVERVVKAELFATKRHQYYRVVRKEAICYKLPMELRHLQTLLAIRDRKSFTAAAKSLDITQAAVSQHVANVEESLGVRLFDRRGRSVQLTPAGQKLCDHAERITQLVASAIADVQGHTTSISGALYVASSTIPAATVLPGFLSEFRRQYPQVRPELRVTESLTAIAEVESGKADLGFVGLETNSKQLIFHKVAEDELVLIVAPDDVVTQKKSISLKQLAGLPLIVREPHSGSYLCLEAALLKHGVAMSDLNIAMQTNSNDAIVAAVREGNGVSFISQAIVAEEIRSGDVVTVRVRTLRPRRKLYMITPRDLDGRETLQAFIDFVHAAS
mgnify:CR=1 FL=1